MPAHNARFAKPPEIAESGFVAVDPALLAEILCVEGERVVSRDNTVSWAGSSCNCLKAACAPKQVSDSSSLSAYPSQRCAQSRQSYFAEKLSRACEIAPSTAFLHPSGSLPTSEAIRSM
ncbi:hypothetical protein NKJ36_27195 [Mesorhizobium sp. M0142]|uniref:hypothetical protein n=1 Tax=unclassified Mesorhizobium TaxID=325217 RepID=UPI00333BEE8C